MKAGLALSTSLHALLIGLGLVTVRPEQLDVPDVQAVPVELIPLAEITQVQKGAEDAPLDGPSAPTPAERPNLNMDAVNVGDNERDQATPQTQTQQPVAVEEARLPDASPTPVPAPVERPRAEPAPMPEPPATPATEIAPEPEPARPLAPEPADQAPAAEPGPAPEPRQAELPDQLPVPTGRPERPPVQTAQTPNRHNQDSRRQQAAASPQQTERSDADEVANLLNRERGSGGGAASSQTAASLGGERASGGTTLTQSEMDALRNQIQACWNPPAGIIDAADLRVSVRFSLDRTGRVQGRPTVTSSSGNRQADESAVRAVQRCSLVNDGFRLPADKYDAWQVVIVNFDPAQMF